MRALALSFAVLALSACASLPGPVGNPSVPEPARPVDLNRYSGLWHEIARYENGFEEGCEGVTAEYSLRDDGLVGIRNTCREGSVSGEARVAEGRARVVEGSANAKLEVSFFGPFFVGDYWVLDRADDYSWAVVGEPSGRYLWLLHRRARPSAAEREALIARAVALGYDRSLIRLVEQPPA